jgi:hypothetical protein
MPQTFSDDKFIYSVDMMLAYLNYYKPPPSTMTVAELSPNLECCCWGDPAIGTKWSASNVMADPDQYQSDYKRIVEADLSFPIIVYDRHIVDGVHRLSKAHLDGRETIQVYQFDDVLMAKFIIADKGCWDRVRKMALWELICLFCERFQQ